MIYCENIFCIYQALNVCTLAEVNIDSLGMCGQCIYPSIPDNALKKYKTQTLHRLNSVLYED